MTIDPRFIVDLHGKQFISYQGVGKEAVVQATAEGEKGTYTGLGDASPQNVGKNIATATLRMAETRAVNRALRAYLGIGMTTFEEMPPDEPAQRVAATAPASAPTSGGPLPRCPDCGSDMWDNRDQRAKDKADPNKKNARPAFKCKKNRDHAPIWESDGWEQKVQQAERQTSQDEMDSLDAADRYDDSPDYSTEDPPF